ncbi:MAG: type II secretion system protein [bacterium]
MYGYDKQTSRQADKQTSRQANFSTNTALSQANFRILAQKAMTLAEVIIVLGILGLVAEMTLPSLIQNVQDAQYKTGKDKVRMSIAEAGKMLSVTGSISDATSAEDFVKNYLATQLKIVQFCAPADMEQCGMPSGNPTTFKNLYDTNVASMPSTWSAITSAYVMMSATANDYSTSNPVTNGAFNGSYAFLSADGIAVNLFYNPYCALHPGDKTLDNASEYYQFSLDTACMSGVYDMNGLKKPNQVGKDIGFFGVFYNGIQSTSAAALPYKTGIDTHSKNLAAATQYCSDIKGYKLPTVDELSALYLGRNITGMPDNIWLWCASRLSAGGDFVGGVGSNAGTRAWGDPSDQAAVRCVRD